MTINTSKTRGRNKLFKGSENLNRETALVTYIEYGKTKTAVFRNDGCLKRATAKMNHLRAAGRTIISFTGGN